MSKMITYVLPVYNEAATLKTFHASLDSATKKLPEYTYHFLFVDDGSTDGSYGVLEKLAEDDPQVQIIRFSRNFGHQIAVTAGIDYAVGDAVIIMDTDLQDPPETSLELIKKWQEGYEVVYAQRKSRQDSVLKKLTAHLYYRSLHLLANIEIPKDTGDFRLLDKKAVVELRKFRERNRFVRGMVASLGFRQVGVLFDRKRRENGSSGYTLKKMLQLAGDGITSFSTFPLELINRVGTVLCLLALLTALHLGLSYFFIGRKPDGGYELLILAILFVGGLQMLALGIVGLYIGRIHTQILNRPLYTVSTVVGLKAAV